MRSLRCAPKAHKLSPFAKNKTLKDGHPSIFIERWHRYPRISKLGNDSRSFLFRTNPHTFGGEEAQPQIKCSRQPGNRWRLDDIQHASFSRGQWKLPCNIPFVSHALDSMNHMTALWKGVQEHDRPHPTEMDVTAGALAVGRPLKRATEYEWIQVLAGKGTAQLRQIQIHREAENRGTFNERSC